MASTETLIKDFVRAPNAWKRLLVGGAAMYLFLPFGYFRMIAQQARSGGEVGQIKVTFDKAFWQRLLKAWPLGAFYCIIPLLLAWSWSSVLNLMLMNFLIPPVWGLGIILSLTLTAVALVVVEEDPERYFLGLEFEEVLGKWWKLRRVWAFPALTCYGIMALFGNFFYGLVAFGALEVMVRVVADGVKNKE